MRCRVCGSVIRWSEEIGVYCSEEGGCPDPDEEIEDEPAADPEEGGNR